MRKYPLDLAVARQGGTILTDETVHISSFALYLHRWAGQ